MMPKTFRQLHHPTVADSVSKISDGIFFFISGHVPRSLFLVSKLETI
jgi:hypothetical protein